MSDTKLREKADALIAFTQQGPRFIAWVQAVTDTLAPAPEKAAKVCGNCGEKVSSLSDHVTCAETGDYYCKPAPPAPEKAAKVSAFPVGNCVVCGELVAPYNKHAKYEGGYTCQRPQPAPPEPAASELPEAVKEAVDFFRELGGEGNPAKQCTESICRQRADALEAWARSLAAAQPVGVGMTTELATVIHLAELRVEIEERDHAKFQHMKTAAPEWRKAIAAVRQQAAQGRKVELGKVRDFLTYMGLYYKLPFSGAKHNAGTQGALWQDAIEELDAAEKGEGRG